MTEFLAPLMHGLAVVLGVLGVQGPGALLATLGALALAGMIVALVRASLARTPRHLTVGLRARRHAVLLRYLPDASHPDARGHVRSRAPGRLLPAA
ncbi:MAG: hypothetical protein DI534_11795 [Leifsonia xyli]|nr:MAG: hypothetical protein DI534_11795 [Leifsonia xyli]